MANRFTATEKWIDPWFCELNEKDKLFWIYLVDNCDHAGMWQVNWPLVKFHIKDYVFNEEMFKDRVVKLKDGKWFIPKFIEFQYKTGLNPENRAHLSVINILKKEGAFKGLERGIKGRKDMDMVKDKDKNKVNINNDTNHDKDKDDIREFFEYYLLKTKKSFALTPARAEIISARLKTHTMDQLKQAVDIFIKDDWPDRHKHMDIVYCIGVRNKIDNLEKWLNIAKTPARRLP